MAAAAGGGSIFAREVPEGAFKSQLSAGVGHTSSAGRGLPRKDPYILGGSLRRSASVQRSLWPRGVPKRFLSTSRSAAHLSNGGDQVRKIAVLAWPSKAVRLPPDSWFPAILLSIAPQGVPARVRGRMTKLVDRAEAASKRTSSRRARATRPSPTGSGDYPNESS